MEDGFWWWFFVFSVWAFGFGSGGLARAIQYHVAKERGDAGNKNPDAKHKPENPLPIGPNKPADGAKNLRR